MRSEIVISSTYEAAWCQLNGHACRMVLSPDNQEMGFIFKDTKELRAARRQFEEDIDLQAFVETHRRLEWRSKTALKERKCGSRGATCRQEL